MGGGVHRLILGSEPLLPRRSCDPAKAMPERPGLLAPAACEAAPRRVPCLSIRIRQRGMDTQALGCPALPCPALGVGGGDRAGR